MAPGSHLGERQVSKLTVVDLTPVTPRCSGCEAPLVPHQDQMQHIEPAWFCITATCPRRGCQTCYTLVAWYKAQDEALGVADE